MRRSRLLNYSAAVLLSIGVWADAGTALAQTEPTPLPTCSLATPVRQRCALRFQTRGSTSRSASGALNSALARRTSAALAQCKSATGARSASALVTEVTGSVYGSEVDNRNRRVYYAGSYGIAECVPTRKLTTY